MKFITDQDLNGLIRCKKCKGKVWENLACAICETPATYSWLDNLSKERNKMTIDELATKVVRYEQDELDGFEIIDLFQELINNGMAWSLQGHYGRMAMDLVNNGLCVLPEKE